MQISLKREVVSRLQARSISLFSFHEADDGNGSHGERQNISTKNLERLICGNDDVEFMCGYRISIVSITSFLFLTSMC
jgi:hypothetical protein